ncbi:NUDIX hydrolase [Pedomonas sp. V897]|uniref:NUDIX hydrolase n=1 Tax=Pedomonas sp. V897 TaxID=3446482 RepID=UPI003EE3F6DB
MSQPVRPVPAATLLLIRDTPEGLEVFMVVRNRSIGFASGALVFPGGKVDTQDSALLHTDLAEGFDGLDPFEAACRVAALREAYEEAGVLLAHRASDGALIPGKALEALSHNRAPIASGALPFADFLRDQQLRLAAERAVPVARWITPPESPKRFDTLFYVAAAPQDQTAAHDGGESVDSVWLRPAQAIAEGEAGKWLIIVPTRFSLEWLAQYRTVAEVMAAARTRAVRPITGRVEVRDGVEMFCVDEDAGYPRSAIPMMELNRGF